MGEEKTNDVKSSHTSLLALVAAETPKEASPNEGKNPKQDSSEKALVPFEKQPPPPVAEKAAANHTGDEKKKMDSNDRDAALAKVELEKRWALIKAWEENEKSKADNKAYKKLSAVGAWENTKKASVDAQLKKIEEEFERKKAKYAEKMKNKKAEIHRAAEEKRASVEAERAEEVLKIDEAAAKFKATGTIPKKLFGCFS
ncbi:OLC1v1029630C1 [Oldenlandia corymbosa var. corymbosa]|uniref:OLC1v1029630C1 n=1 Tax=Oldenlandia corymbosa var. corymbosa TaxID=529605 RepID=A0AAV1CE93_OLDCO|nr:OLC1v1029630C1 [Oldenlandia corymbosa var. corymbosa]